MLASACSHYLFVYTENRLSNGFRAVLYIFGLVYCFVGLSSVTSRFFLAMENIVKQTREVVETDPATRIKVLKREKVWNFTVADITLLAFGTSFPQISLATIGAIKNLGSLYADGLGPGTLVGSAACDLFLIHAVCIIIPRRTIKKITNLGVWIVELVWSLWAYIWLYIILQIWTPEVITIWEASMTVLQFFLLILHAYAQDREWPFVSIRISGQERRADWVSGIETKTDKSLSSPINNLSEGLSSTLCDGGESSPHERFNSLGNLNPDKKEEDTDFLIYSSCDIIDCHDQEVYPWSDIFMHWKQQFIDLRSFYDTNGKQHPSKGLYFCWQLVIFPWKFMFAFVPPCTIFHGWVTFICSLVFITCISYIVTKLTDLIGCVTGVNSYVIALTALATGTSWPDLVASMIAADRQATADSAVANITCSNSVNIFIGIGVPWVIDVFYNKFKLNEQLKVPALELGFTLTVYFITSLLCVAALVTRRFLLGGELGGPKKWAWASSVYIMSLWIAFMVLSCLRVYNVI